MQSKIAQTPKVEKALGKERKPKRRAHVNEYKHSKPDTINEELPPITPLW